MLTVAEGLMSPTVLAFSLTKSVCRLRRFRWRSRQLRLRTGAAGLLGGGLYGAYAYDPVYYGLRLCYPRRTCYAAPGICALSPATDNRSVCGRTYEGSPSARIVPAPRFRSHSCGARNASRPQAPPVPPPPCRAARPSTVVQVPERKDRTISPDPALPSRDDS